MKESYNPFRMWGAYVGAILGLTAYFLLGMVNPISLGLVKIFGDFSGSGESVIFLLLGVTFILNIVIGFLVGWGVHSLIRKLT